MQNEKKKESRPPNTVELGRGGGMALQPMSLNLVTWIYDPRA